MANQVESPPVALQSASIVSGASLSSVIDLGSRQLVSILMPATWTAADITFQVSLDNVTYYTKKSAGDEYKVSDLLGTNPVALDAIDIPYGDFTGFRYLKIRSGTAGSPVNQGGARTLTVGLAA